MGNHREHSNTLQVDCKTWKRKIWGWRTKLFWKIIYFKVMKAEKYLNSKEAKTVLKVQDCDLAHIRNAGKLKFVKKGNAFM